MNLLEKCKKIVEYDEHNYYKNLKDTDIGKFAPRICQALLEAMEEIEELHKSTQFITDNNKNYKEFWGAVECGEEKIIEILRKHLEVEK